MRGAFDQAEHPRLRIRALEIRRRARPAIRALVGGRVGQVQGCTVHGHQPPRLVEAGPARNRQRLSGLGEQLGHHRGPQPGSGLKDCRLRRHLPVPETTRDPFHPGQQRPHHFLVRTSGKQGQRHHVVNHQARGQEPGPLLSGPGPLNHRIHHIGRENPRQHTERDMITQPFRTLRGHPSTTRHAERLTHPR